MNYLHVFASSYTIHQQYISPLSLLSEKRNHPLLTTALCYRTSLVYKLLLNSRTESTNNDAEHAAHTLLMFQQIHTLSSICAPALPTCDIILPWQTHLPLSEFATKMPSQLFPRAPCDLHTRHATSGRECSSHRPTAPSSS